jgi:aspartate carbamoyltransferase regulatory subunit
VKVIDNRKARKKVRFEDLKVGEGYLDADGNICIKTSYDFEYVNCMFYREVGGEWEAECEYNYTEVTPIQLTYTIEG